MNYTETCSALTRSILKGNLRHKRIIHRLYQGKIKILMLLYIKSCYIKTLDKRFKLESFYHFKRLFVKHILHLRIIILKIYGRINVDGGEDFGELCIIPLIDKHLCSLWLTGNLEFRIS